VLRFLGTDIDLAVTEVLVRDDAPTLFVGQEDNGDLWLVSEVQANGDHMVWICAPISERALACVRDGQADPDDALRHSLTGTGVVVCVDHGHPVADCQMLSKDLPVVHKQRVPKVA
jgi:hypothetical protein